MANRIRTLLLAVMLSVAVSNVAHSTIHRFKSAAQFETFHSSLVNKMSSWGVQTQHACFTSYCTSYQERTDDEGTMLLGVMHPKDGAALKEFCFETPLDSFGGHPARQCAFSNGTIYNQAYLDSNQGWINVDIVVSGFGD